MAEFKATAGTANKELRGLEQSSRMLAKELKKAEQATACPVALGSVHHACLALAKA